MELDIYVCIATVGNENNRYAGYCIYINDDWCIREPFFSSIIYDDILNYIIKKIYSLIYVDFYSIVRINIFNDIPIKSDLQNNKVVLKKHNIPPSLEYIKIYDKINNYAMKGAQKGININVKCSKKKRKKENIIKITIV